MIERERFEAWARQRWTHPEDFDQRIKAPSKYNNYEVQAAWEAWQERSAQPAPSVPDDIVREVLRDCCGTFHGSRHRITCEKYKGKKAPETKP